MKFSSRPEELNDQMDGYDKKEKHACAVIKRVQSIRLTPAT